jgi:tetratricopeptide (TPR) repeat protein
MSLRSCAAWIVAACAASALADGAASPHESLFRDLAAETEAVRDGARVRLERAADLSDAEVKAALSAAGRRAKPLLIRVAAARGMKSLVPDMTAALASQDPLVADAAARGLVTLGDDAVAAGRAALVALKDADAASVLVHLDALAAQRAVERAVLARWRRKGGSYEGRYSEVAKLGWPVQPVLLAMLLDIPLCDRDVVVPPMEGPAEEMVAKALTLRRLAMSTRRGYRTFEPLPTSIESEELFGLAAQALKDVADLDLMGDILESVAEELEQVDESMGPRLRRFEEFYCREIDIALAARGRPQRLERLARRMEARVEVFRRFATRARGDESAEQEALTRLNSMLGEYGQVMHQLRRFDEAAKCFEESLAIDGKIGGEKGKLSAISGYNRACALACGGRIDEAFVQLDRALDRDLSAGGEDLTREWVIEDGDLRALHDDPRWAELVKRRFDAPSPPDGGRPPVKSQEK